MPTTILCCTVVGQHSITLAAESGCQTSARLQNNPFATDGRPMASIISALRFPIRPCQLPGLSQNESLVFGGNGNALGAFPGDLLASAARRRASTQHSAPLEKRCLTSLPTMRRGDKPEDCAGHRGQCLRIRIWAAEDFHKGQLFGRGMDCSLQRMPKLSDVERGGPGRCTERPKYEPSVTNI